MCGPSLKFYEQLLKDFTDFEKLKEMERLMVAYDRQSLVETLFETTAFAKQAEAAESGLGKAPTEPEGNSSTILYTKHAENALPIYC